MGQVTCVSRWSGTASASTVLMTAAGGSLRDDSRTLSAPPLSTPAGAAAAEWRRRSGGGGVAEWRTRRRSGGLVGGGVVASTDSGSGYGTGNNARGEQANKLRISPTTRDEAPRGQSAHRVRRARPRAVISAKRPYGASGLQRTESSGEASREQARRPDNRRICLITGRRWMNKKSHKQSTPVCVY